MDQPGIVGSYEDKYFTPSIEDLRVGYECEYHLNWDKPEETPIWNKIDIMVGDFETDNYLHVRVPYLTKEQIEAEGWRFSKDNYDCWEYDKWELEFSYHTKTHMMEIWKGGQKPPQCLFYGECKDINTFRYICKLLGI